MFAVMANPVEPSPLPSALRDVMLGRTLGCAASRLRISVMICPCVFFRSSIEGVKINGWQCEVAPIDHHTGGIYESYGRGWLIQPDSVHEKYLKTGKWNKLRLKVVGDEVTTWLNGHQMIYLKDEKKDLVLCILLDRQMAVR